MGKRVIVLFASMALALALYSGAAFAHPLMFESDLTEDGIVNFCNPEGIRPGLFEEAISDWNSYATDNSFPSVVDVTGNVGAFCELRADAQGGDSAGYYARVVFTVHPDNLDLSTRFNDLSVAQRGATLRHELGHAVVGLDHNHLCSSSVMPTLRYCNDNGTPRRTTVGPHDADDRSEYWNGPTPIYPIHDKCWTNVDADGDGFCDLHGPPTAFSSSVRLFTTRSVGDQPVWAPQALEN
ncbi:MAG TPA: hypothetical protein VF068_12215 [Rubrobacter sp.]